MSLTESNPGKNLKSFPTSEGARRHAPNQLHQQHRRPSGCPRGRRVTSAPPLQTRVLLHAGPSRDPPPGAASPGSRGKALRFAEGPRGAMAFQKSSVAHPLPARPPPPFSNNHRSPQKNIAPFPTKYPRPGIFAVGSLPYPYSCKYGGGEHLKLSPVTSTWRTGCFRSRAPSAPPSPGRPGSAPCLAYLSPRDEGAAGGWDENLERAEGLRCCRPQSPASALGAAEALNSAPRLTPRSRHA